MTYDASQALEEYRKNHYSPGSIIDESMTSPHEQPEEAHYHGQCYEGHPHEQSQQEHEHDCNCRNCTKGRSSMPTKSYVQHHQPSKEEMVEIQEKHVRCRKCNRYYPENCSHMCPPETTPSKEGDVRKQIKEILNGSHHLAISGDYELDTDACASRLLTLFQSLLKEEREAGFNYGERSMAKTVLRREHIYPNNPEDTWRHVLLMCKSVVTHDTTQETL